MKTIKLHEIIQLSEEGKSAILIELIVPYKKQLLTYYKSMYNSEPILVVTSVMNAAQYGFIVPFDEFTDAIINFIGDPDCMNEDNDNFAEYEIINFNSMMLEKL